MNQLSAGMLAVVIGSPRSEPVLQPLPQSLVARRFVDLNHLLPQVVIGRELLQDVEPLVDLFEDFARRRTGPPLAARAAALRSPACADSRRPVACIASQPIAATAASIDDPP